MQYKKNTIYIQYNCYDDDLDALFFNEIPKSSALVSALTG